MAGSNVIARTLEDQCRHLHARYVASMPKIAEAIADVRGVVVPQVAQRATRRKRPLKMALKDRSGAKRAADRAVATGER